MLPSEHKAKLLRALFNHCPKEFVTKDAVKLTNTWLEYFHGTRWKGTVNKIVCGRALAALFVSKQTAPSGEEVSLSAVYDGLQLQGKFITAQKRWLFRVRDVNAKPAPKPEPPPVQAIPPPVQAAPTGLTVELIERTSIDKNIGLEVEREPYKHEIPKPFWKSDLPPPGLPMNKWSPAQLAAHKRALQERYSTAQAQPLNDDLGWALRMQRDMINRANEPPLGQNEVWDHLDIHGRFGGRAGT